MLKKGDVIEVDMPDRREELEQMDRSELVDIILQYELMEQLLLDHFKRITERESMDRKNIY